jgi:adenylate cyclase
MPSSVSRRRPTLAQAFGATFVALALVLCGLLWLFYAGSRRTLLQAADQLTAETSQRVSDAIEDHLREAERVVAAFEARAAEGLVRVDEPAGALTGLLSELAGHPEVSALSLTHGQADGFFMRDEAGHEAGEARLQQAGRWQVSVARAAGGRTTTVVSGAGQGWQARVQRAGMATVQAATDPTLDPTFVTPARAEWRGRTLWSDLYLPSLPDGRPEGRRVVTVQKALWAASGGVAVLRASLQSDRIDELVRIPFPQRAGGRPLVFIADGHGHLVARLSPQDEVRELPNEEVRVIPAQPHPALSAALGLPLLATLAPGATGWARVTAAGQQHLLNLAALPEGRTQGWIVGTLVPESYYLAELEASLRRVLLLALLVVAVCLAGGALILRATRRDLGALIRETTRLRRFDFAPATVAPPAFEDVMVAADSLEQAKTALRALGKYVPLDLVRQLYESRSEPVLGGRVQDISMVFSDIEGFTSVAEALPLDVLAKALGRYLEAMTGAIHGARGIIDKYTGDGVMALWNAPAACDHHATFACEGVLACVEATERLFAGAGWAGLPPFRTRFGIHRAEVNVGHFGAPDRMSYTVMGDGVNLAARLEGLNKQYGTRILVSADVEREARETFWFRRLDRVAVKGRQQGVEVYELVGRRRDLPALALVMPHYEQALEAYFARRFDDALALLAEGDSEGDPPSRLLAERCRNLRAAPPPPEWNGVHVAKEK